MCGICGMLDTRNEHRTDEAVIRRMMERLSHRGPDACEYYVKDNLALGFTRLSIIDLAGGMQPISNEDDSIILICNGEVFNFVELRKDLKLRGHKFKTNCDVEVIIHLYEEKGVEFLNDLNGQFALALYDFKRNRLICARDYAGIVPLFYTVVNGVFIFASEIKAILEHPGVKREVDLVGLDQILTFPGLISPRTLFKNISSLQSGHYLSIDFNNIENHEYWDLIYPKAGEIEYKQNESYYIEKLDDLITNAVKLRLRADVPIGFYISGGLDSSIIASKIKQLSCEGERHSFSIDFTDRSVSESKFQRIMAGYVESNHHEILFNFSDISNRLSKVIYHSECALKETYNTASMALSQSVRSQGMKVVLTGEGADELFGGYVGYRFDKLRRQQAQAIKELLPENEISKRIWGDEAFIYEKNHHSFQQTKRGLYSPGIAEKYEEIDCLNHHVIHTERVKDLDVFHRRSYVDFKLRMCDHLLSDHGDRMAYANSVEARYPFLDKDLIEFSRQIPTDLKLNNFCEKYILKKVAENLIPKEIINRPKFAFVAPGSPKLLTQNIEYMNDLLSYDRIRKQGYFNADTVERLKKQYTEPGFKLNVPYDSDLLITVITFGMFLEQFKMPDLAT